MAKATLNPNLQAIADKFFDETKIVREIALLGIQQGKFTREDLLKALREGRFPPETAEALRELFKPTPAEPKPEQPKPLGPQERLLLPIMCSLWPPDGVPPDQLSPGEIVQQVGDEYEKLYKPRTSKRTTILKIVKFNRQGRYQ